MKNKSFQINEDNREIAKSILVRGLQISLDFARPFVHPFESISIEHDSWLRICSIAWLRNRANLRTDRYFAFDNNIHQRGVCSAPPRGG